MVVGLFIIATEDEDLVAGEGAPAAAAEKGEIPFDSFDHRVDFDPLIRSDVVNFNMIIILPIGKNTSQFEQAIISYHTQTRVNRRILTRLHGLSGINGRVKNFKFPQNIIIPHPTHNINQSPETSNRVTTPRILQIRDRFQIFCPRGVLVDFGHFSFSQLICATDQVDHSVL